MKKRITLVLIGVLTASMMTGCYGTPNFKDGTYKATAQNASHGWTDFLEVTVENGKITKVDFDALDEDGNRKSESEEYEAQMKEYGSEIGPMEFYPEYEKKVVAEQSADVDAVAGATTSGKMLKELFDPLRKSMVNGEPAEITVENAVE